VAHEDFAGIGFVVFEPGAIAELLRGTICKMLENPLKNLFQVLGAVAPLPTDISGALGWIQFDGADAGAILASVAHLL
jgi:hypothetical protein